MNTTKYRKWWYYIVLTMIRNYAKTKPTTKQGIIIEKAMEETIKETVNYNNYRSRLQAIELIFFRGYSTTKVAQELHFSERTVKQWKQDFVYEVGENAGF